MLSSLKFVQGAIGKKDLVPALTHFHIANGRVSGYNGRIAISAPIPLDIDCCPQAIPFVKAVEACQETVQLHLTASAKLSVRSGAFKAHVATIEGAVYPEVLPEGDFVEIDGNLMPALRALFDFSSDDASKPWSNGILFDGESAFATNNIILAEHWLGYHFPYRVNVPRFALKEMLRINEEPVRLQIAANSITFHYEGERWLRSQLINMEWPPVAPLFARIPSPMDVPLVPEGMWAALEVLAPFVDEMSRVYAAGDRFATALEEGASVELQGAPAEGIYNHKMLSSLEHIATRIGFEHYPAPLPFYGEAVRGLFVGLKA